MNIKDAASRSNLPPKTIRYYEEIGLIAPDRDPNGYRAFSDADVHKLAFVGRARALGFGVEDCRALLSLWEDDSRASSDVKALAKAHLEEIDARIEALRDMRGTLAELMDRCAGDSRPDCPILRGIAGQETLDF